ncbi:AMP-binding protein [Paraburkholderia sp. J67]|uniref:AMP-binding protein n=1 Tax=Paraburkholderia sp. J67 TaxID=2805435 RepID=UPI002ABE8E7B|nr:AMP-binding protein [Paraburkholderia sp. J67]
MKRIWHRQYQEGVPLEVDIDGYTSMVDFLDRASRTHPHETAMVCLGVELTYSELDILSRAFASYLLNVEGLLPGDRVAVMLPNLLHYPVVVYGALRAGLALVNLNPHYTAREVLFNLQDSGASLVVACEASLGVIPDHLDGKPCKVVTATAEDMQSFSKLAALGEVHDEEAPSASQEGRGHRFNDALALGAAHAFVEPVVTPDTIAFLQYTGGTTGKLKAAVLTHRNIIANLQIMCDWFRSGFETGDECIVTVLPIYHIMGLSVGCFFSVAMIRKNVFLPNPRDLQHFVAEYRAHRFTFLLGVNTLFNALLEYAPFCSQNPHTLRQSVGAGAQVEQAVARRWASLTGCPLLAAYGLTEASPSVCAMPLHIAGHADTVGVPFSSTDIVLLDEEGNEVESGQAGEIAVRGPQVMRGYWNCPEETAAAFTTDGYLRTGDIGVVDQDGFVKIVDRKKDVVLVSGFNVYPNEIEAIVCGHDKVIECACIGVPDEKTGEALKVFVVARDRGLTGETLERHAREHLTAYKVPRQFEFVEALPKSPVGKILRRALRS